MDRMKYFGRNGQYSVFYTGRRAALGLIVVLCLLGLSGVATDAQIVIKPLKITTTSLPDGAVGETYEVALSASGGKQPYIWSVAAGVLPNGLSLSATGTISGTPAYKQYESFTIKVQDAAGANVTKALGINVNLVPKLRAFSPTPFSNNAPRTTSVDALFNEPIRDPSPVTFSVHGSMSGRMPGTYSGGWTPLLSFQPNNPLWPGEEVEVALTRGLISNDSIPLGTPIVTRFRAATAPSGASYFPEMLQFEEVPSYSGLLHSELVDLNNDGMLDFLYSDSVHGITLSISNRLFQRYDTSLLSTGTWGAAGWGSVNISDIDNDGDIDIVAIVSLNTYTTRLDIMYNDGNAAFPVTTRVPVDVGPDPWPGTITKWFTSDVGDVNGDGSLDILINTYRASTRVYFNDGAGNFNSSRSSIVREQAPDYGSEDDGLLYGVLGDLDNDGDLDVLGVRRYGVDLCEIFFNDGTGTFSFVNRFHVPRPAPINVGDFDNDGDLDFVTIPGKPGVFGGFDSRNRLYLNDGEGEYFSQSVVFGEGETNEQFCMRSGDMNGDGYLDLVVGTSEQNRIYLTDSLGYFHSIVPFGVAREDDGQGGPAYGVRTRTLALGDMDADGDLDIAAHHYNPGLLNAGQRVYENR